MLLYRTGEILSYVLALIIAGLYFCLGKANSRYTKAAICMAVYLTASVAVEQFSGSDDTV